jgi:hypothetical protein
MNAREEGEAADQPTPAECGGCPAQRSGDSVWGVSCRWSALDVGLFIETKQKAILDRTAVRVFFSISRLNDHLYLFSAVK